jgi:hypothetical protein
MLKKWLYMIVLYTNTTFWAQEWVLIVVSCSKLKQIYENTNVQVK